FRIARAESRCDRGVQQSRLALGGSAERAQVARRDAEAGEPSADRRDLRVGLAVETLAARDARGEQPELLQLAREPLLDPCALAESSLVELGFAFPQATRRAGPALRRSRLPELLADHLERQELVPLQPQDRLQPLELLLAEEPVAAARPPRRHEPLPLEVADLRDRDVRELRLEAGAGGAARQHARAPRGPVRAP